MKPGDRVIYVEAGSGLRYIARREATVVRLTPKRVVVAFEVRGERRRRMVNPDDLVPAR